MEEVKQIKAKQEEMWNNTNRFHSQIRKEQEMLAREIQEVRKGQINHTLVNNQRAETEKVLQQAVEKQARDTSEMRKQLNNWTRHASAREAYSCWAHQQANPNLSEIPSTIFRISCKRMPKGEGQCSLEPSSHIMGQALPHNLINKNQCHCGLHLLFRVTNHLFLLQISPKVV
ncbi:hypothetical protein PIB30_089827 [Stylosanthes scabra]|uniref:Uncharacterized protein n=1 Tax=Stylosanthes scabra TaxID=79078 RepID=A0ABU6QU26_9FABA|nr:hypothetical protein [Stylosanthes scabra]